MTIFKIFLSLFLTFTSPICMYGHAQDSGYDSENEGISDWELGSSPREIREKLTEKLVILNQNCQISLEKSHPERILYFGRHIQRTLLCDNHLLVNEQHREFEPVLFESLAWLALPFVGTPYMTESKEIDSPERQLIPYFSDFFSDFGKEKIFYYNSVAKIIHDLISLYIMNTSLSPSEQMPIETLFELDNSNLNGKLQKTCLEFYRHRFDYFSLKIQHDEIYQTPSYKMENIFSISNFQLLNTTLLHLAQTFSKQLHRRIIISFDFDDTLFKNPGKDAHKLLTTPLLDPTAQQTFNIINDFGFSFLIVTARFPSIHAQTIHQLAANNITPNYALPNRLLEINGNENSPYFRDGILYTCHKPKGPFIPQILDTVPDLLINEQELPIHYFHIDDCPSQCRSVSNVMERYCPTTVFHYTPPRYNTETSQDDGNDADIDTDEDENNILRIDEEVIIDTIAADIDEEVIIDTIAADIDEEVITEIITDENHD